MSDRDITGLLHGLHSGDTAAAAKIMPLVYDDLRRIASSYARRERDDHTLQATALVHEAYLKLFGGKTVAWQSRAHFLATAARVMRHILVDYSRRKGTRKRGGDDVRISLHAEVEVHLERAPDLVALDDALTGLAQLDPEGARLVELRFFAGLSLDDAAECLGVSRKTAVRRWRRVRAWLHAEISGSAQ